MARTKKAADGVLGDLKERLEQLVETAKQEGRDEALAEIKQVLAGKSSRGRKGKAPAKKPAAKKKRKNPWANLTDEQRLARINAIRKGKGLPPRKSLDD